MIETGRKAGVVATGKNDIIEEYLTTHQQLDREIEGRLNVVMLR